MAEETKNQTPKQLDDDATEEDSLGRLPFARSLARFIQSAPADSSYRIGIYGGWGEGKTSVMKMMDAILEKQTDPSFKCLLFVSWSAPTVEELRAKLLYEIAVKLGLHKSNIANKAAQFASRAWQSAKDFESKLKAADVLVTPALDWWRKAQEDGIVQKIGEELRDQRLVVFVDDLDRVRPEVLPELLLHLREALDLPNVHYVLGVSPQVVEQGLASLHKGWGDAGNFLEKIIEYPAYLPEPSEAQIQAFIRRQIRSLGDAVDGAVLEDLIPYLPRNPRRLKLFLRCLYSMRSEISRFWPDEIGLSRLYLCQMLRLEFPQETRRLCRDVDELKRMEYFFSSEAKERILGFDDDELKKQKEAEKTKPGEKYAPVREADRARFLELCDSLTGLALAGGKYSFVEMVTFFDHPPLVTYREAQSVLDKFKSAASEDERRQAVYSVLAADGVGSGPAAETQYAESAAALILRIADLRKRLHSVLVEADSLRQQREIAAEVTGATDVLRFLFGEVRATQNRYFDGSAWAKFCASLREHIHFIRPAEIYRSLREEEAELLNLSLSSIPSDIVEELYPHLIETISDMEDRWGRPSAALQVRKAFRDAAAEAEKRITARLLERFEQVNGVDALWGSRKNAPVAQRILAFRSGSAFHKPENRRRLYEIARRAKMEVVVQINFLEYFRMLAYAAIQGSSVNEQRQCQILVTDKIFLRTVWKAAVAQPLNLRAVGSLNKQRDEIIAKLTVSPGDVPLPKWFARMVERDLMPDSGKAEIDDELTELEDSEVMSLDG